MVRPISIYTEGANVMSFSSSSPEASSSSSEEIDNITDQAKELATLPTSHYSSLLPYQKAQVRSILLSVFSNIEAPLTIVDCTSHIGGDAIHFSAVYPNAHIYAIDIDPEAIRCMKSNIDFHGSDPSKFTIINDDAVNWIFENKINANFYYFDPPWGGPTYHKQHKMKLYLSNERIETTINRIFNYRLTNIVILKIPKNFDIEDFEAKVKHNIRLEYVKKTHKKKTAYGILIITAKY